MTNKTECDLHFIFHSPFLTPPLCILYRLSDPILSSPRTVGWFLFFFHILSRVQLSVWMVVRVMLSASTSLQQVHLFSLWFCDTHTSYMYCVQHDQNNRFPLQKSTKMGRMDSRPRQSSVRFPVSRHAGLSGRVSIFVEELQMQSKLVH